MGGGEEMTKGGEEGKEEERGNGEGKGKGGIGGNSALVVGGIDAPGRNVVLIRCAVSQPAVHDVRRIRQGNIVWRR